MSLPSWEWLGYAIVTQTYSHFAFCSLFRQETDSVESLESINTELQFLVYFNPPSHRGKFLLLLLLLENVGEPLDNVPII